GSSRRASARRRAHWRVFAEWRFACGQRLRGVVEAFVFGGKARAECPPVLDARPAIDCDVAQRIRAVAQELSADESWRLAEEPRPVAGGPVAGFELGPPRFTDREFPERLEAVRRHQRDFPASHCSASATVAKTFRGTPRLFATVSANFMRSPPALTSTYATDLKMPRACALLSEAT